MATEAISIPGVEIVEELGRGSHGVVYRALREGRSYAVKIPLGVSDDGQVGRRFLREAVSLARLNHSALPAVLEVGHSGALPYLIMELVSGETLAQYLKRGPLKEAQALELGHQLASALVRIHDAGLVHRDIRPQNILFDAHTTAIRLVDFGLAIGSGASADLPAVPPAPGRDGYLPGELGSEREDLRALGAVLFEALLGVAPSSLADPASLLGRRGEAGVASGVSPAFSLILRRLLGLGQARGYADAQSVLSDLERASGNPSHSDLARPQRRLTASTRGNSIPLIGRGREMDRLRSAWRASRRGNGQVVVVRGAAGSGKTRLTQALLDEVLGQGCQTLAASCGAMEPQPFAVIAALIESHLDDAARVLDLEQADGAQFRQLVGDLAPLLTVLSPRLARIFRTVPSLEPVDGVEHMMVEGLAELMARILQSRGPGMVALDDVQWLDSGSRRVLTRLVDRVQNLSVLLVFISRDEARNAPGNLLRRLPSEAVIELTLAPLEEARIAELVRSYLGGGSPSGELTRHVSGRCDGTPLSVTETLRSMLELGVLVPHWGDWSFDVAAARSMGLPRGAQELLARRMGGLEPDSAALLTTAAVIGVEFQIDLLTRASQLERAQVELALADARRALLVEEAEPSYHRFLHDSVREALLARLSAQAIREIQQRVAEALDALHGTSELPSGAQPELELGGLDAAQTALTYRLANHYASGIPERAAARRAEVCGAAGRLALRSFDNELAVRFLEAARVAARECRQEFGLDLEVSLGEARSRLGDFEAGLAAFRRVVEQSNEPLTRALAFSRIAWIQMQIDTNRSWQALDAAFVALGVSPPQDSIWGLLAAIGAWLVRTLLPRTAFDSGEAKQRAELLCALYYQSARLASYTVRPLRLLQSTLRGIGPAERLGPSSALSNGYLMYSFVLTLLGFRKLGKRYLEAAESVAKKVGDPTVYAHTLQVGGTVLAWAGEMDQALAMWGRTLDEYGHWRELSEYCLTAHSYQLVETVRGRTLEGWKALERGLSKLSNHDGPPLALEFFELSARATLCALGREHDAGLLLSRLAGVTVQPSANSAFIVPNFGWRVRMFTECGKFGPELEAIVSEVKAQGYDPRRVHLAVTEYYVHLAHARVHACLRADPGERAELVVRLRDAAHDLNLAARIPLLRAHAHVIDAYVAWFAGDAGRAQQLFLGAERLARQEAAPWVLYAVHRGQAHMLLAAGKGDAASDEAHLAEALAREHGAAYRLRWIREEFQLRGRSGQGASPNPGSPAPYALSPSLAAGEVDNTRPRRYLKALVRLGQNNVKELDLEQLGRVVLAELINMFRAERGFLFLSSLRVREHDRSAQQTSPSEPPPAGPESGPPSSDSDIGRDELMLLTARSANGDDLVPDGSWDPKLIEELFLFAPADAERESMPPTPGSVTFFGDRAVIATPLFVGGKAIGVVYLDRPLGVGVFDDSDARALGTIAQQVPLVLELAKSLRAKEIAKETERSSERLDAIARLAGGIAHDFNNMLSVIFSASEHLAEEHTRASVEADVSTIQSAAERARDLTRQLLAFSRGQYLRPEVIDLNELVSRLEPIFRRLLGNATLELLLEPELCRVKADPAQIDQVLTNLVVNAADAMPRGGTLRIETSNQKARNRRRQAQIVISDTGDGMSEATLARVFEPFFTTKGPSGNGLGLATAHGIIKQSGGQIALESKLGVGTTFRISLPEALGEISVPPPPPDKGAGRRPSMATILLVDDEPMVREAIRRILASRGYRVVSVPSGDEALKFAADRSEAIDLLITDVIMPKMNGLELARELDKVRPDLKVLFVSGHTRGVFAERGVLKESVEFLPKPISMDSLTQRVDALLRN